ncbi:hypothetical protein H8356DRAFT_1707512 [Neocallimastix lanati (nom. inval.)]|jgi:hypothetical protein|uniref:DUF3737 family protein n=1 Tax=Neocallimastix californiae TaxID=1754190 RepID=A0A1Y2DM56_9FUNG|nr:hypothetical protein H8356DRAFT_1707512 [Neocallimastix sp. JGI-2020a]ORY60337.1 hypothetical protein LY90DRAFT_701297 [Neocallimastix californiae]|eukprot:ORY60337.1 hypothetical protein LY90DRAFT_701297 [Neocallimastix californiae]
MIEVAQNSNSQNSNLFKVQKPQIKTIEVIENQTYDEERALYNTKNTHVKNCTFAGPKDGESVLKESRNVIVDSCNFSLRYPLWHCQKYILMNSTLDDKTRAPIWYANDGYIDTCTVESVKCLRECHNTVINNCTINSEEFGWKCDNIEINNSTINSVYMLFDTNNVKINNIKFTGKYSFQYMENLTITNSYLDTKDAFWHSKNVTVKNSTIKGEYLAWFSENLTLINCKIIGTQPLCYCKNLKMINCTMEDTDLSFEYSEVEATINGHVLSIKNPKSGSITVDSVGDIILEDSIMESNAKIIVRNESN